jgi:ABC-type glycerol-3-phosphate transport system permease component
MLPTIVMLLPLYLMLSRAGMIDTYIGVTIVYVSVVIPSVVWLMWSFFKIMPKEIEESAYIDGSGYFTTFIKIVVPITSPALASVSILTFTASWNEFYYGDNFDTYTYYNPATGGSIVDDPA